MSPLSRMPGETLSKSQWGADETIYQILRMARYIDLACLFCVWVLRCLFSADIQHLGAPDAGSQFPSESIRRRRLVFGWHSVSDRNIRRFTTLHMGQKIFLWSLRHRILLCRCPNFL